MALPVGMVTGPGKALQFNGGGGGMDPATIAFLGGTAANVLGNLLGSNTQKKLTEKQLAEQKRQFDVSREDRQRETGASAIADAATAGINRQVDQAKTGLQATQMDPLAQQRARQRNAVMSALIGGARNYSVKPPDDIASSMPEISGGIRLPEGGFGPDVMNFFSPSARAGAEGQFWGAAGRAAPGTATPNLNAVGYGTAGDAPTRTAQAMGPAAEAQYTELERKRLEDILAALGLTVQGTPMSTPISRPDTLSRREEGLV